MTKKMLQASRALAVGVGAALTLLAPIQTVLAGPYSALVVYGDSLSDNGNFSAAYYAATGTVFPPSPPYYAGRRSNGPVAVEHLAAAIGAPLIDFAWIGATSGVGNYGDGGTPTSFGGFGLPGMTTMFDATKGALGPWLADGLFVVWGGPNDILAPSPLDISGGSVDWGAVVARAVANQLAIVSGLQALGAQHILVPGMPELGLTPYFRSIGAEAFGNSFTATFNAALEGLLPDDVIFYDTAALFRAVVNNPGGYGFTNVLDACFDGVAVCTNPDQYLFFDDFHPTAMAHSILASEFAAAVPEPGALALLSIAFAGLGLSRRKGAGGRGALQREGWNAAR